MYNKHKYDKIRAMFALSQCKRIGNHNPLRNKYRIYYCEKVKLSDIPSKAIGNIKDIEDYKYQLGI